jgi:hypothetical protein
MTDIFVYIYNLLALLIIFWGLNWISGSDFDWKSNLSFFFVGQFK